MTSKSKGKRQVRDVQEQTGWPYQHTLFLVQQLGYDPVSEAVDACAPDKLDELRRELGEKARVAQRAKAKEGGNAMMPRRVTILTAALLLTESGQPASAGSYTTVFGVQTRVGGQSGTVSDQNVPTGQGMRMVLPVAFSDFNCKVTPRYLTDDGSSVFVNIVCDEVSTPLVFGATLECPTHAVGTGSAAFWARAQGSDVLFVGACATKLQGAAAPASVGNREF
jgi:hypothetical protein